MSSSDKAPPPTPIGFIGLPMSLTTNRVAKQVLFTCFAGVFFYTLRYIVKRRN